MKNLSVFQTLFYGITSVIAMMVFGAYLLISNSIEDYTFLQVEQSLYRQTLILEKAIQNDWGSSASDINKDLNTVKTLAGERLTLIDKGGVVLFDSKANPDSMDNHAGRPEIIKAFRKGWGSSKRYSRSINIDMIYVAKKINLDNGNYRFVRISLPLKSHLTLLKDIRYSFLQAFLIAGFIGLLIAFLFSKNFAHKIKKIGDFAKSIAENEEKEVSFRWVMPKEMSSLIDALSYTNRRMQSLFKKVNRDKQKLKGIIEDIAQGLIIISKKDKISLANEAAKYIWGDIDREKGKFQDILKNKELIKAIVKTQNKHEPQKVSLQKENNYYEAHLKYFPKSNETLVIFNDITEFINLQNIKKEFVANVSHELRTPLTAIKGFLESVDQGSHLSENHLEIIRRNTERLIALVEDLMSLSEFESRHFQLELEEFDLVILIRQIIDVFSLQSKDKNIELILKSPDELIITADSFRLEEVIFNLLSNAIKYTEKGKVFICIKKENNYVVVSVKDTGVGIPQEALEKIFERFFVVDKSRSRESGGTGLGLSIVKHIIRLHRGRIEVKSQLNEGSEFIIYLPENGEILLENNINKIADTQFNR